MPLGKVEMFICLLPSSIPDHMSIPEALSIFVGTSIFERVISSDAGFGKREAPFSLILFVFFFG